MIYGDPNESTDPNLKDTIRIFKKKFAAEQLPMLNMDKIEELVRESEIESKEEKLKPNPANGDNDEDFEDGLGGL